MSFRYLSVCSGLEGASLAFEPLGASAVGFAEIEPFPSAIIAHHYGSNLPGEPLSHNAPPNFGDFTTIDVNTLGRVDLLVGGTPCQAFSIAGRRLSLADARGNLTLAYAVLAHELARSNGLRNCVWENVPGVLSATDNAFGCFLAAIVGADDALHTPDGGSWPDAGMVAGPRARAAWRILDAQYFGLAQRRRRVFLVADFGKGADPAAVLFERASLRGNSPPSRNAREGVAPTISARTHGGGGLGTDFDCDGGLIASTGEVSHCLNAGGMGRQDYETETLVAHSACETADSLTVGANQTTGFVGDVVAHSLRADGFDASEDGTGRGTPIVPEVVGTLKSCSGRSGTPNGAEEADRLVPVVFDARQSDVLIYGDHSGPLDTDGHSQAIAFSCKDHGSDATSDIYPTMRAMPHDGSHANAGGQLAVAFDLRGRDGGAQFEGPHHTANIRAASGGSSRSYVAQQWAVRRLTPEECEKLQGVPVGYTRIPWRSKSAEQCPDGPRYKALGNSWAVPVVNWIGRRLMDNMPK